MAEWQCDRLWQAKVVSWTELDTTLSILDVARMTEILDEYERVEALSRE